MNDEIKSDLKELKVDVKELIKVVAVASERVRQHEDRSLELKSRQDLLSQRLEPIEGHVKFVSTFLKWAGGLFATAVAALLVQIALRLAF